MLLKFKTSGSVESDVWKFLLIIWLIVRDVRLMQLLHVSIFH